MERTRRWWTLLVMSQTDCDDEALLRAGDRKSLTVLFDRHEARVFRHASRLVSAREDAKDVTLIAFFELWRHRGSARLVEGSALPWLLRAATNVARNVERSSQRYRRLIDRVSRVAPPAPAMEAPHGDTEVMSVLNTLPASQRTVVVLTIVEGYGEREAAQLLGVPVGTVKSRLSRAKARLREHFTTLEAS
jgi:RNA polymerase sigma factor (sigma-70 family)